MACLTRLRTWPAGLRVTAAAAAVSEAADIARRLHCQPLLDRAADLTSAELRITVR